MKQDIEDAFDARWEHWLDSAHDWAPFFGQVAALEGSDVVPALRTLELIDDTDLVALARLKTSAEGRAVPLSMPFSGTEADVTLLALGFARGGQGALAVPYARNGDS